MIDQGQRHRRKVLGWVLIGAGLVPAALILVFGRVLLDQMMLGTVSHSYALVTAVVLILLALLGAGAYLLRTVRGR